MRRFGLILGLMMICNLGKAQSLPCAAPCDTGDQTFTFAGQTRHYRAYFPPQISASTPYKVLMYLNGFKAANAWNLPSYGDANTLTQWANANGVAILWPSALIWDLTTGGQPASSANPVTQATSNTIPANTAMIYDVDYFDPYLTGSGTFNDTGYLDYLINHYLIGSWGVGSTNNVMVLGFSTGGLEVQRFAIAYPNDMAGVGIWAGPLYAQTGGNSPTFNAPVNVFMWQGSADATLNPCGTGIVTTTASIANGSATLTAPSGTFSANQVGEEVTVSGATLASGTLISNYISSSQVTLSNPNTGSSVTGTGTVTLAAAVYFPVLPYITNLASADTGFNFWSTGMGCTNLPPTPICTNNAPTSGFGGKLATGCEAGKEVQFTFLLGGGHVHPTYEGLCDFYGFLFPTIPCVQQSTVELGASPNPASVGMTVTLTATVSGFGGTPTGSVTFMKDGATMGASALNGGQASFNKVFYVANTKSMTAAYSGDANFAGSTSSTLEEVVNQATTTTTLVSSPNPSAVGQSVTLTATVTPEYSGTPTGTVAFYDGTTLLDIATISGGQAAFSRAFNHAGMKSLSAVYSGDTNFTTSTGTLTQTVQ